MKPFFTSKEAMGWVTKQVFAMLIGTLLLFHAVSPVAGADLCLSNTLSRDQSESSTLRAPPARKATGKNPIRLRLMGGPRQYKLSPDTRSVPPETIVGTQGVAPMAGCRGQQ